jgi:hypothetical protein
VSGFPNRIVALQFEWQWQNPKKSRIIKNRQSILNTKTVRGYRMSLKVLNSLLETALWKRLNLVIHFIDPQILSFFQSLSINSKTPGNQQLKKCVLNSHAELDVMHKPLGDATEDDDMESDLINLVCCICKKSRYCDMPHTTVAIGDDDIQTVKVHITLMTHKFKLLIKNKVSSHRFFHNLFFDFLARLLLISGIECGTALDHHAGQFSILLLMHAWY